MSEERRFYTVTQDLSKAPLRDHLMHGYEERRDFEIALRQLSRKWKGRIGECVGERYGFLLLRFHDTPGGVPDEAWIPHYLLTPVLESEEKQMSHDKNDLDSAFEFD